MTVHIYNCPECGNQFTEDHPDEQVYEDPCPQCYYRFPDLVDMFEGPEGDE
jgi:DNA-directed RNA polymerase subunit RPC12/RpoP